MVVAEAALPSEECPDLKPSGRLPVRLLTLEELARAAHSLPEEELEPIKRGIAMASSTDFTHIKLS
jgi:hypothetical protein